MKVDPVKLLPALYEASASNELWPVFLKELSEQLKVQTVSLVVRDENTQSCVVAKVVGVDPEAEQQYQDYYGKIDAFYAYANRKNMNVPGVIVTSEELVPNRELFKTEYGNDFLLKFDLTHHCFALFGKNGVANANLSLIRSKKVSPFDEPELKALRFLAPHVHRAILLDEKFTQLRLESEAKQKVLDQLGTGIIFLDATGRVLGTNEIGLRLLSRQDGIFIHKGRLKAGHVAEEKVLQSAILQSCMTGAGHTMGAGAGLLISRRPPARPLQLVIGPACARVPGLSACPTTVIFISDFSAHTRPHYELLKALYGLTPAECRLAFLLMDGKSSEEITNLLGIKKNTLKTHIQSIFSKTNVRRQSQLIRLLMSLPVSY